MLYRDAFTLPPFPPEADGRWFSSAVPCIRAVQVGDSRLVMGDLETGGVTESDGVLEIGINRCKKVYRHMSQEALYLSWAVACS